MRLFVQGKVHRRFKWPFSEFLKIRRDAILSVAGKIISGETSIKDVIRLGAELAYKDGNVLADFISNQIRLVFEPIVNQIEKIKDNINIWLSKHPFVAKAIEFLKCFINNNGIKAIISLVRGVTKLVTLIATIVTPVGWIQLVISLVCGWESLKEGIKFLNEGIKETKVLEKYNFYGKFFGSILKALA